MQPVPVGGGPIRTLPRPRVEGLYCLAPVTAAGSLGTTLILCLKERSGPAGGALIKYLSKPSSIG